MAAPTALPESTFTVVWMTLCLVLLFGMLVSDKIGADLTMMFVLTLLMLPRILTVPEAIAGFSNEGLLTVVVLFVVAGGISQTGGLDWYMAKILGRPKTLAGAQFKLMVPIAFVSAFLNNTPVVMVMIPIVQRWAKTIKQPSSQLLIPLSFASILGGTCTLIGTSTNLVVAGLLSQYNFCDPATAYCNTDQTIGLFDLGLYGVPIAMVGIGYILLLSPFLLPYPDQGSGAAEAMTQIDDDDLLVSARITKWSPAGGKTVKDSGMRGLPGLFLVSVQKKESGMTYRAVGPNMRLDAGDILSFTGVVETLGQICEEHGLEPITNENDLDFNRAALNPFTSNRALEEIAEEGPSDINSEAGSARIPDPHEVEVDALNAYLEEKKSAKDDTAEVAKLGATKEQFMATDKDTRVKAIAYMRSLIRKNVREDGGASPHSPMGQRSRSGSDPNENDTKLDMFRNHNSNNTWSGTSNSDKYPSIQSSLFDDPSQGANGGFRSNSLGGSGSSTPRRVRSNERQNSTGLATLLNSLAPAMVVVAPDPTTSKKNVIFVGVNASDRVGLLHDLSKGMSKLGLQALHTEASVVGLRSVSIWRCEVGGALRRERRRRFGIDEGDVEEIWSVLNSILSEESGTEAIKQRGLRVIRTRVIENSTLIGKTANEAKFRVCFRAAIVAIQRGSKPPTGRLGEVRFEKNDVLLLQVGDDSPLLTKEYFDATNDYKQQGGGRMSRNTSRDDLAGSQHKTGLGNMVRRMTGTLSRNSSNNSLGEKEAGGVGSQRKSLNEAYWNHFKNKPETSDSQKSLNEAYYKHFHRSGSTEGIAKMKEVAISGGVGSNSDENGGFYIGGEVVSSEMVNIETEVKDGASIDVENAGGIGNNTEIIAELVKDLFVETALNFEEGEEDLTAFVGKEFLSAMVVVPGSSLVGKTMKHSGISKLPGVHLFSIERPVALVVTSSENDSPPHEEDDLINENASEAGATEGGGGETVTISQDEKLQEKDILWWSGSANAIGELRKIPGLAPLETDQISKIGQSADRRLVQAVVAKKGPLVGKSIKQSKFRTRFNCAVIAVHREGTKVKDMPGRIVLQAGDVLLLEAGQDFVRLNKDNTLCFALLSELDDSTPPRLKLLVPALLLAVAMLAVYSSGVASLLETALCASAGMVTLGILTQQEARDAVNWDIYVTIAAAFGIGKAMVNSGVAGGVASGLTSVGKSLGIGDSGILAMIYLATFLISNVVTNNAAAALIFPIAIEVALDFGTSPKLISYTLMLSASASFMSPFGYQTNLMVYGPGGYKYMDFLKFGTPMQIVLWLFSVCILSAKSTFLNFFIIWLASLAFMILAFVGRMKWEMKNLVE
ncbi:hypothetical protein TrVE_jg9815 [Triparma verrucosa]|uniref:RCK C-terminal domain-containing protein n=1 Tax=Triparma verrucosa TaxID=1606542 RepID=A0A9W7CBE9_9STRA|nr:hypothetical protein TrVE_jg9815 [Triparma verrucosa]